MGEGRWCLQSAQSAELYLGLRSGGIQGEQLSAVEEATQWYITPVGGSLRSVLCLIVFDRLISHK